MHGAANVGHINHDGDFTLLHAPTGWAKAGDPLTFVHELGHILGCNHNREVLTGRGTAHHNHGYIMRGSATDRKSGLISIMALLQLG